MPTQQELKLILDEPEFAGVYQGDLVQWTEEVQDILLRTAQRHFETVISEQMLAAIPLDDVNTNKLPKGRQVELIRAMRWCIAHKKQFNVIVEQGGGKTKISINGVQRAILQAWRRGKKFRVLVIAPGYLIEKWAREFREEMAAARVWAIGQGWFTEQTAPHLQVLIANHIMHLNPAQKRSKDKVHSLDADVILCTYEDISLSHQRVESYVLRPVLEEDGTVAHKPCSCMPIPDEETGKMILDPDNPCCPGHYRYPGSPPYFCGKHHGETVYAIACPRCGTIQFTEEDKKKIPVLKGQYGNAWRTCCGKITLADKTEIDCNEPLWQATAKDLPAAPRFHNDRSRVGRALKDFEDWGRRHVGKGSRKLGIAEYFQRHLAHYFRPDVTIVDEVHMAKSAESARGMAVGNLLQIAQRSPISLTATATGGYASSVFALGQRTWGRRFRTDFGYREVSRFVDIHGTYAKTYERGEGPKPDEADVGAISSRRLEGAYGRPTKKEIPGLSPAAYPYFLEYAGFALLSEIFPQLPPYREHVATIELANLDDEDAYPISYTRATVEGHVLEETQDEMMTQAQACEFVERELRRIMLQALQHGSKRYLGVYSQNVLRYPNICTEPLEIRDPETEKIILKMSPFPQDAYFPKEQQLLREVVGAVKEGLQVLVYVNHVHAPDVAGRVYNVLTKLGTAHLGRPLKVAVLRAGQVKRSAREAYIKDLMETQHYDVLVCSPKLVEMGLDLLWARRIIWYQQITSVYTMSQAARRSWRPGVQGKVDVTYLLYQNTAEMVLAELMAKKMRVHALMSGSGQYAAFTRDLSGAMDLTTLLAERLGSRSRSLFVDPQVLVRMLAPQVLLTKRDDIPQLEEAKLDELDLFA